MGDFYLDADVTPRIARVLIAHGQNATRAQWVFGNRRTADEQHLLYAALQRRILVTHNWAYFVRCHDIWVRWFNGLGTMPAHAGILAIPQPHRLPPEQAAAELIACLESGLPLDNELYVRRVGGGWYQRVVGIGWRLRLRTS